MTTAVVKTCSLVRKIYTSSFLIGLYGCTVVGFNAGTITWKTYRNHRYGFEFPYPSNWTSLSVPENNDGITLISPENNTVEIRAWAGNKIPYSVKNINSNFQTAQGVSGVLVVEVNQQVTSMKLTITHQQVTYYWQGRSKSQEFQDYYHLFYYIAQHYQIPN